MNTITANELSALSGYSPQRIRQFQIDGILPKPISRGKLPANSALSALFKHMRAKLEKYSESRASAQNREQRAKATLAEVSLHEKLGNLTSTADWRWYVVDFAVTLRETILHHKDIPDEVGRRVLQIFREMKLKQRADKFRATCPRCLIPIIDDLDLMEQLLKATKATNEKEKQAKRAEAQKS
jgi:hypothetical protein